MDGYAIIFFIQKGTCSFQVHKSTAEYLNVFRHVHQVSVDPPDRAIKIYFMFQNVKQNVISALSLYLWNEQSGDLKKNTVQSFE